MAKRRAGAWARREAARRRRELMRMHWKRLSLWLAIALCVAGVGTAVAALVFGSWMAWMVVGAVYMGLFAIGLTMFESCDPETRRYTQGADGEELTARELRRHSRSGWHAVHNIVLETGDIDHIAVGPGGAVAIETKCPNTGWRWLERQDFHRWWVRQTKRSVLRARALIRQYAGVHIEPTPLLVVWTTELKGEYVTVDGVRVVHGRDLLRFLDDLPVVLDEGQVKQIHLALESIAEQFDAANEERRVAAVSRATA